MEGVCILFCVEKAQRKRKQEKYCKEKHNRPTVKM